MPGLGGYGLGLQRPTLTRTFSMADPSPSKLFDASDLSLPDGFFDKCTSITSTTHEDVDDTQDGRPSGSDDLPLEATYPSSETDPPLEQLPFLPPLPPLPSLNPPLEALPSTTVSIKQPPTKPAKKAPQLPAASRTITRKRLPSPNETTPTPPTQPTRKKRRGQRAGTYQCLINGELYDCPFHYDIVPKSLIMSMLTRGTQ